MTHPTSDMQFKLDPCMRQHDIVRTNETECHSRERKEEWLESCSI